MTALDILRQLSETAERTAFNNTVGRYQFETQDLEVPWYAWTCWNTRYIFSFTAVIPGAGEVCLESEAEFTQPLTTEEIERQWRSLALGCGYFERGDVEVKYPCCDFFGEVA
ncbi:hypothetical protein FEK30_00075 (plasmid) [Picosynechococcus sp. PCC 11901]|uniref:hypothetical protein n=1 Tax=Picosynechococcus sp. PCC 11901 TaxID=2579791 RepID=UPI0010FC059E|nr:hypothetical protein [Picosynechococcus sp. PCC 11901]QCS47968.1 hypothetical protein FEK30_00075 [Picosynechococcus sp. PCC 11901]